MRSSFFTVYSVHWIGKNSVCFRNLFSIFHRGAICIFDSGRFHFRQKGIQHDKQTDQYW